MDISKEELKYWQILGLDDKGRKIESVKINEENFCQLAFNNYEGNVVKNALADALEEYLKKTE